MTEDKAQVQAEQEQSAQEQRPVPGSQTQAFEITNPQPVDVVIRFAGEDLAILQREVENVRDKTDVGKENVNIASVVQMHMSDVVAMIHTAQQYAGGGERVVETKAQDAGEGDRNRMVQTEKGTMTLNEAEEMGLNWIEMPGEN